jgi:hypothetical protein
MHSSKFMHGCLHQSTSLESSRDPTCQFGDCRFGVMINKKMIQSARKHEVQSKLQDITQVKASQHLDSSIPIDLNWTTLIFAFISIYVQMISTILAAFKHFHKVLNCQKFGANEKLIEATEHQWRYRQNHNYKHTTHQHHWKWSDVYNHLILLITSGSGFNFF